MSAPHTGGPLKKAGDERVAEMHARGMSQGEIARTLGVSRWQVRKAGERIGLEWDTTATATATRAAEMKARRDRERLAERYLDLSHDLLDRVDEYMAGMEQGHAWESLKSAATATDKLVALQSLSLRYTADQDTEDMQVAMSKFDELIAATRATITADYEPSDH